ncbi:MAG: hypothetical protein IPJ88_17635 [Myxococcales bacterium]|nr:MAG: hypothetical protein IPJ88_17635 [Myxococcales bacterium]
MGIIRSRDIRSTLLVVVAACLLAACTGEVIDPAGSQGEQNSAGVLSTSETSSGTDPDISTDPAVGTDPSDSGSDPNDPSTLPKITTRSAGCDLSAPSKRGTSTEQMLIAGANRTYSLSVPASYDHSRAYPLFFGFHGSSGGQATFVMDAGYEEDAIFIHPEALQVGSSREWLGSSEAANMTFFDTLVADAAKTFCINLERVFVSGFSLGGEMASYVGCKRGDIVRGMAPIAGTWDYDNSCVGQVASYIGVGENDGLMNQWSTLMAQEVIDFYQCSGTQGWIPNESTCVRYTDCNPSDMPVAFCELPGVGHTTTDGNGNSLWGESIWRFSKSMCLRLLQ